MMKRTAIIMSAVLLMVLSACSGPFVDPGAIYEQAAKGGVGNSGGGGGAGGNNGGGTLVVSDIPAVYNGKYAGFEGLNDNVYLVGAQSVNVSARTATLVQIVNGRVSLPMWAVSESGSVRYSGNDTFPQDDNYNLTWWVGIFNSSTTTGEMDSNAIAGIEFPYSLIFKNGSAAISANTGTIHSKDGDNGGSSGSGGTVANPGGIPDKDMPTDFSYYGKNYPLSICINDPASVKVSGGKVDIKLGVPKDQYLEKSDSGSGVTVTPSDTKFFGFEGFTTVDEKYYLLCVRADYGAVAALIYADKDATIKGTSEDKVHTDIYDFSLKKGWNYIIETYGGAKTTTYTSSVSQPGGFTWTVFDEAGLDALDY